MWTKWMLVLSILVMTAGLCFALVFPYLMPQVLEAYFTEITGDTFSSITPAEMRFHNLLSAVIGGTMLGWGLLLALLSYRLTKAPEDWIWSAIALSIISWALLDMLGSALAGSTLNILLNLTILIAALPPLIMNRRAVLEGLKQLSTT